MKTAITTIATILLIISLASSAYAEVPAWVKNNAGWWADGTISETEFLTGIEFLVKDGVIIVPPTSLTSETSDGIPTWLKNNAGWWADGTISDGEFVNGIQHLMMTGLISVALNDQPEQMVSAESQNTDSKLVTLEAELEKCSEIVKASHRIDCQKPIKKEIMLYTYQMGAEKFTVGPINYYWFGIGSEGNDFEVTATGQPILSIRMLAENTHSEIVALNCTSPQICSYDVWDGSKAFKYSGMDFTSGQIALNPNDSREFNILFGPNIGYGGTEFEYDSGKDYQFRIDESFGSVSIPLNLE